MLQPAPPPSYSQAAGPMHPQAGVAGPVHPQLGVAPGPQNTVVVQGGFDAGARFVNGQAPTIPVSYVSTDRNGDMGLNILFFMLIHVRTSLNTRHCARDTNTICMYHFRYKKVNTGIVMLNLITFCFSRHPLATPLTRRKRQPCKETRWW